MKEDKISSPFAGLTMRNLGDSVDGAHPVVLLELSAGFSHPRNPEISRLKSALIAPGKEILSFNTGRISLAGGGVGTCEAHRKNGPSRPTERGRLKPLFILSCVLDKSILCFLDYQCIPISTFCFLDRPTVRRPSVRRRREILPYQCQIWSN